VILGAAEVGYVEMMAETVTAGDPTYTGPLAGVSLGLPVYHVTEPEIKAAVNPDIYRDQVELLEMVLDVESIWSRMADIRQRYPQ